ncbi:HAD family hydrolase [Prosthecobacter vanneervenii]|uniref:HAD superfamily phosphoserine phosphatase-like hydrolase n=1 Tax=Prosthecobacter vanneervenii TaxID=48466 RepID=A0A7W8DMQ3_9BACT|nr:HAD family hydrolase [Prosthecobacter vanneervenii]MBB5035522.1 HAD superfamily phosphoserine phosphatase-like hydrolase [Prosthecobacter vanneervenii]
MPARSYAFFDLDHTLLPFDTQALFCNFVLHREPWRVLLHALFVPVALGRACGLVSTATAKRAFLSYLRGMSRERLAEYAHEFASVCVPRWAYPDLRAEILRHKHQNRILVLNTASPDFYAREIAHVLGFDYCIATRFEIGRKFPGMPRLVTGNNKHEAKIVAMEEAVPGLTELTEKERANCWSYSDSAADLPLLEYAGYGVLIHPSGSLAAIGRQRDWAILRPERPYRTKAGDMLRVVLQMFGLHPE